MITRKRMIRLLLILTTVYVSVGVLAYVFQTHLIFFPGKLDKDFRFIADETSQEVFLHTKDKETISGLFIQGTREDVILYFHGNAGDLSSWQYVAQDLTSFGFSFFIIDYRGYGKSSGKISEQGFYEDAWVAYEYLIEKRGFRPSQIIVYGRSIGSGVAIDLASKFDVKGLILEAPYTSLRMLAQEKAPFIFPQHWINYSFDNLKKIQNVKSAVLVIHGTDDAVIPIGHSEQLIRSISGKKLLVNIDGASHNNLNRFPDYFHAIALVVNGFFDH
jgi:pimeloyl-ACP methyl ester carboxylesterase